MHFLLKGINYILINRISPKHQDNEFLNKLNKVNSQNGYNNQTKCSNSIEIQNNNKPKYGSWSEFSTRNSSPLPYW